MRKFKVMNGKWLFPLALAVFLVNSSIPSALAETQGQQKTTMLTSMIDEPIDSEDGDEIPDEATPANADQAEEYQATATNSNGQMIPVAASTGDLWSGWMGNTDFSGNGTKSEPYRIYNLSQLMGLSEMVAAGLSFAGQYIELAQDIDLGSIEIGGGNWNPIGWYQNAGELAGSVSHPFKGHFDGCGNTISGLRIVNPSLNLQNIGLFGAVEGGSIKNLIIEADYVSGIDNVGILAGSISGTTIVYNVAVTGYLAAREDAGGIAGEITGSSSKVTIENCTADGIIIYSEGDNGFIGGIAGNVQNAYLIDSVVNTYDGDSSRIAGRGYVGGIAGRMNQTDIYNSFVSGTIGGNGSKAVGGIVGKYESGNLILARFAGDISRTNHGTASREGTFAGTRESRHNFTYGTGANNHLSYLFTTSGSKAKQVFGSSIDGDNTFAKTAHIGYWTDNEKKYTLVAGTTETGSGDTYFYEELEAGVKHIITQKLGKEFTSSGYYQGLNFKLDHFAPGYQGEPIRGYLVSIPRIDTLNANGTYDTDVASLTAMPAGNHSFYRQIDKDNPSAVAYGAAVTIVTAPKYNGQNRYQMVFDESEPGKVKPPTYLSEMEDLVPMAYQAGGTYTFTMPACDTEINVEYRKVTTELTMDPEETEIAVIHTRSGDRKNPSITTEVKNQAGILIARYINGVRDAGVEVQPVSVHAEHNQTGAAADKSVKWVVDDTDLITNLSASDYTLTDAKIMPNLDSGFILGIMEREVQAQSEAGYKNKISNTIYYKFAVLTAASNPATSADNQTVYGNTKITVSFQIIDNTTIRVEGMELNKSHLVLNVTRTLTGDRTNPAETYTCSEPIILTATLNPNQPFFKHVSWTDKESGKVITLAPGGDYNQDCVVTVRFDEAGKENPAWLQNVINADNASRRADPYGKLSGRASYSEAITAASEDQTNGHVTASCDVTINFETIDKTVIYPERVEADPDTLTFDLVLTKSGRRLSPSLIWSGIESKQMQATVYPVLAERDEYEPFNRAVKWESADNTLIIKDGVVTPNPESEWIKEVVSKSPYQGSREIPLKVTTVEQGRTAQWNAVVNVSVIDNTYSSGGSGSSGGGGGSTTGTTASGTKTAGNAPVGSITGEWIQTGIESADKKWTFVSGGRTYANEWAYIHNPYAAATQPQANWFRFSEAGHMLTGWYQDSEGEVYFLNSEADNTQGRMFTGWNWIDENGDGTLACYYFHLTSGALLRTTEIDGYQLDANGRWMVDEVVQTQ